MTGARGALAAVLALVDECCAVEPAGAPSSALVAARAGSAHAVPTIAATMPMTVSSTMT